MLDRHLRRDGTVTALHSEFGHHSSPRHCCGLLFLNDRGWPKILSNLKSLLETGKVALYEAYPAQAAQTTAA